MTEIKEVDVNFKENEENKENIPDIIQEIIPEIVDKEEISAEISPEIPETKQKLDPIKEEKAIEDFPKSAAKAKGRPRGSPNKAAPKKKTVKVSDIAPEEVEISPRQIQEYTQQEREQEISAFIFKMMRKREEDKRNRKRDLYRSWFP